FIHLKRELEIASRSLENKKQDLEKLKIDLESEKAKLTANKESKELIIAQTQDSEIKFQNLLYQVRFEKNQINQEILQIENEIREKLNLQKLLNPDFVLNPDKLMWPIVNQGITTYFRDPDYPFRGLVGEHSGLDIRTLINGVPSNGLPVRAAASGIVIKTIDNGRYTGNAVYISHGDLMTIYLHLSQINVSVDDFITIGQAIGLSGGMPGTVGAGLSTGAHLHFEVRSNGIPVNPCDYLDPSC
ncbi:MAG TPA: peptidoglycan DD-metalloendopeptidase family protein, partial [Patescibacteria group bacterium]